MRTGTQNGKRHATQQSLNGAIKSICDVMRRSNCAGSMQYVPELTWILFLRILDEREQYEAEHAEAVSAEFSPSFAAPFRYLRGTAAQDGREGQRRRAVLHAPGSHPRGGARRRPEGGRDGVRPRLRHRRVSRAGLRVHARPPGRQHHTRRTGYPQAQDALRPGEGEPDLSDRARQSRPAWGG